MAAATKSIATSCATSGRAASVRRLVPQENFGFVITETDSELLEWLRSRSYRIRFVGKQANLFLKTDERMYEVSRSDGLRRLVTDSQRKRLNL